MRKTLIKHHEQLISFDCLRASKDLIRAIENTFKREQGNGDKWPYGEGPITPKDVREMVEDCNKHFAAAGLDRVNIKDITCGRLTPL